MKKLVLMGSLMALLVTCAPSAFAQFSKEATKAVKNMKKLERVVLRGMELSRPGQRVIKNVPKGMVPGNRIGLLWVKMPPVKTPVTQSYINYLNTLSKEKQNVKNYPTPGNLAPWAVDDWMGTGFEAYVDQSRLARDLDKFYKGKADVFIGPDGRLVKLYMLPVDGILYKPVGYKTPVVLNAQERFVIFDIESKTGQIADNISGVYNSFRKATDEEIYGEFETYEVEPGVQSSRPKDPAQYYKFERDLARANPWRKESWEKGNYPNEFASMEELGNTLHRFHGTDVAKVKNLVTNAEFYVYELPRPVVYAPDGLGAEELIPEQEVVLFPVEKQGLGNVIGRSDLENPRLFEFVK